MSSFQSVPINDLVELFEVVSLAKLSHGAEESLVYCNIQIVSNTPSISWGVKGSDDVYGRDFQRRGVRYGSVADSLSALC